MPSPRPYRLIAALVALLALTGCGLLGDSRAEKAQAAGAAFLADWQGGRLAQAAARTTDPKAAEQGLRELTGNLRVAKTRLTKRHVSGCEDAAPCLLPFDVHLKLSSLGEWRYSSSLTLAEQGERWLVRWAPSIVHPKLTAETRLRRVRELPERAPILDRFGRPLAEERPVVTVGVVPGRLADGARTIDRVARAVAVDPAGLSTRVRSAKPDAFVEVITLRKQDYDAAAARLRGLPGVTTRSGTLTLAPTRSFARGVLGAVTPATKQTLAKAGGNASRPTTSALPASRRPSSNSWPVRPAGGSRWWTRRALRSARRSRSSPVARARRCVRPSTTPRRTLPSAPRR